MPDRKDYKALSTKSIVIGERHRKDMGDLQSLADSIAELGLMQPIGVTSKNELVFGERRLRACRDILGQDIIQARVVDLDAIVLGEYAENEMRKDFAPMERVAIGKALKERLGERQGDRTDLNESLGVPGPQVKDSQSEERGPRTRDLAAKASGFGSGRTFERALKINEEGSEELKDAVDKGVIGIKEGAEIVDNVPKEEQGKVLSFSKAVRKNEIKKHKERKQVRGRRIKPFDDKTMTMIDEMEHLKNALLRSADALDDIGEPIENLAWQYVNKYPHNVPYMAEYSRKIESTIFAFVDACRHLKLGALKNEP